MSKLANIDPFQAATSDQSRGRSLARYMAEHYGMEPKKFIDTIRATVFPNDGTNEQLAAFLMVAKEHNLNPVLREIYAFKTRGGGIQPVVSVDGWMKLINSNPQFDGMEFEDHINDDGDLVSITCRIFRKDRSHPTEVTEYMAECKGPERDKHGNLTPWGKFPARMLRHKAAIQCARYAFGFAGIMDDDEYDRMRRTDYDSDASNVASAPPPPPPQTHQEDECCVEADVVDTSIVDVICDEIEACNSKEEIESVEKKYASEISYLSDDELEMICVAKANAKSDQDVCEDK